MKFTRMNDGVRCYTVLSRSEIAAADKNPVSDDEGLDELATEAISEASSFMGFSMRFDDGVWAAGPFEPVCILYFAKEKEQG